MDVLDDIYSWIEKGIIQEWERENEVKIRDLKEIPYGSGWGKIRDRTEALLEYCRNINANVVFVAHCKRMIDEDTSAVSRVLDIPGRLGHWIPGFVDHIAFFQKVRGDEDVEFRISFQGWEGVSKKTDKKGAGYVIVNGSRCEELNNRVFPQEYEVLAGAFEKEES